MKVAKFKRDDLNGQMEYGIKKEGGTKVGKSHFWKKPLTFKKDATVGMDDLWRKVKKVIVHKEFISEELSWKGGRAINLKKCRIFFYSGNDLALMELYPETYSEIEGKVIPACLPDPGDDEDLDDTEQGEY